MFSKLNKNTRKWTAYAVFVAPIVLTFLIFFVWPWINGVVLSFYKWDGISSVKQFIGLGNYQNLAADPSFSKSFGFTWKFVIVNVIGANLIGLLLALALVKPIKSSTFLRSCFFFPNVLAVIVVGFIWKFIFSMVTTGIFKQTGLEIFNIQWFKSGTAAFWAVCIVQMWMDAGYTMIIYIAGLLGIDTAVQEAAKIDGAKGLRKFTYVTFPLILPSVTVNLFTTLASSFKLYELPQALTGGGPAGSTTSYAYKIYQDGFGNNLAGYASAEAVLLFFIVMIVTLLQLKATNRRND